MKVFIIGGSGSGKSDWAERKAQELAEGRDIIYAATMINSGKESEERIKRHRSLRAERRFITAELPCDLRGLSDFKEYSDTVLIEDLSNLLANLRYSENFSFEEAIREIMSQLPFTEGLFKNILIVSNDVFSDGISYEQETENFIKSLALLNNRIAGESDIFAEILVGIPLIRK